MITQSEVLGLAKLPAPSKVTRLTLADADGGSGLQGFEEMAVLLDADKPEIILDHPVFGPLLQTQKAAIFATGEDGKVELRAKPFPVAVPDGTLGSVKVLHLVPGAKIKGTGSEDNYPVPGAFRGVAADLKPVVEYAARSEGKSLGVCVDMLDLRSHWTAARDAIKALARGLGNVTANDKLYKGRPGETLVDGAPKETKEGELTPVDAVTKGVRNAVGNVYLVSHVQELNPDLEAAFEEGDALSRMQTLCRFLAECPHNLLNCATFVKVLMQLAREAKEKLPDGMVDIEIYGPGGAVAAGIPLAGSLDDLKLNGLKKVHQGSTGELGPFMVRIKYRHPEADADLPVDLVVAKCVMQDDGGHCAKGAGAKDMQADMTGGASMAAIFARMAEAKPQTKIDIVFGVVSNTTDGRSYKVNDVFELSSGVTVCVENTDAEGRIVLADAGGAALKLHRKEGVQTGDVTTVSTLTGHAILVGGHRTIVNSVNRTILRETEDAATASGEGFQGLQIDPHDFEALGKGPADVINVVKMPVGPANARGTSTSAAFIAKAMGLGEETVKRFTQFDIAPGLEFGKMGPKDTADWGLPVGNYLDVLYRQTTGYTE